MATSGNLELATRGNVVMATDRGCRLAILDHADEVTGNVAMTCRYYAVTDQSFYVSKRRYDKLGPEGLNYGPGAPR